jgi:hypothetical protein
MRLSRRTISRLVYSGMLCPVSVVVVRIKKSVKKRWVECVARIGFTFTF